MAYLNLMFVFGSAVGFGMSEKVGVPMNLSINHIGTDIFLICKIENGHYLRHFLRYMCFQVKYSHSGMSISRTSI